MRSQLDEVAHMLDAQFPDVAVMLRDACDDLLAFTAFPVAGAGSMSRALRNGSSRWRRLSAAPRLLHEGMVPSYALMMWVGVLFCLLAATRILW